MDQQRTQTQNRPGTIPLWTTFVVLVGIIASPVHGQGVPAPLNDASRPVSSRLKQLAEDRGQPPAHDRTTAADVEMSGLPKSKNSAAGQTTVVEAIDRKSTSVHESPSLMVPPPAPVQVVSPSAPERRRSEGGLFGFGRPRDSAPQGSVGSPRPTSPRPRDTAPLREGNSVAASPDVPKTIGAGRSALVRQRGELIPSQEDQIATSSPTSRPDEISSRTAAPASQTADESVARPPHTHEPASLRAAARGLFAGREDESGANKPSAVSRPLSTSSQDGGKVGSDSKPVSRTLAARMAAAQYETREGDRARVLPLSRPSTGPLPMSASEVSSLPEPSSHVLAAAPEAGSTQHGAGYPMSTEALPIPVAIGDLEASTELPSYTDSFYPTDMETYYLGAGIEYPRSAGGGAEPPDGRAQTQAGLAPYRNPGAFNHASGAVRDTAEDNPYNRFFEPVADLARPFLSRDAFVYERDTSTYGFSAVADVDLPFVTRSFVPDRAHFKAGPLFLDVLSINSGLLYSDFTGAESFPGFADGQEDGLLSYMSMQTRALARIAPNVYLTLATNLIYLPQENRLGFNVWNANNLGPLARVNWDRRVGTWDLQVYDEFRVFTGISYFGDLQTDAWQRAGRYQFGFFGADNRSQEFYNQDAVFLANTVGARASSLVRLFEDDWRLWLDARHADFWRTYSFDDHRYQDQLSSFLAYDGNTLPFLPTFGYNTFSSDRFESSVHRATVQGRGRLTENISTNAVYGYGWTDGFAGQESWIWDLGLTHEINERASQRLWVGQDFVTNDFTDDVALAQGLGYSYNHLITSRLTGSFIFGLSEGENLDQSLALQRETYGLRFDYRPFDYTRVQLGTFFEDSETDQGDSLTADFNRWIYYANLTQQIASRSNVTASYQFEDTDLFMEHLCRLGVTRFF